MSTADRSEPDDQSDQDLRAPPALPYADELRDQDPLSQPTHTEIRGRFRLRNRTLRQHAARGTVVNAVFMIGLSTIGFAKGFIVAGFLSRADYGVWGVLAVTLGTLMWLKQVGIGDKYIQQDEEDQEAAFQKAFTLELLLSVASTVILAALLPLVALAYGEWSLVAPGLVILLALPAGAFQTPLWIYYRRMQFVRQRALQAVDPVVGVVVSITLAAMGAGYWALVIGLVAGAWAAALVCVVKKPFRLRLRWERQSVRSYAGFSWPLFVAAGATMVSAQCAVFVSDLHLGLAGVGVIALAHTITQLTSRLDELVTGSLYPAICAVKDRVELLEESFVKSNRLALIWGVPFGVGLSLFCSDLVTFGIGEEWRPAVILIQVTGLVAALGQIGFNWDAYFRARGETRPIAVAGVVEALVFLATGIPLLFLYDLRGLAIGIAAQALAHLLCRAYFLQRLFTGLSFARHAFRALLPTVPAVAVVFGMRFIESGERTLGLAVGELAAYLMVTAVASWMFEGPLLREAAGYLRRQKVAGAVA